MRARNAGGAQRREFVLPLVGDWLTVARSYMIRDRAHGGVPPRFGPDVLRRGCRLLTYWRGVLAGDTSAAAGYHGTARFMENCGMDAPTHRT